MKLHAEAQKRFDEMAASLVASVTQRDFPSRPPSAPTERHISATITDADIIGEITPSQIDQRGDTIAKWFRHDGKQYCVQGDAYVELRRVCERIVTSSPYGKVVSLSFVEDLLFDWVKRSFRGEETRPFSAALEEAARAAVHPMTVWIPIAGLEIEGPFSFGPVTFRPITKAMIDRWQSQREKAPDDKSREVFDDYIAKSRRRLQGCAAVVVELEAEKSFATQRALDLAEVALGLLKLHSPGAISPWLTTKAALLGAEFEPKYEALIEQDDGDLLNQRGLTQTEPSIWHLPLAEIARKQFLLGFLSHMVEERGLNDYQVRVRKAVLTLSKASSISDINDRLVFLFSALEGLLLKDSSEPIQHYLGERMAFLTAQKPKERMEIVDIVKKAYGLRSKYIHHQVGIDDASSLDQFCISAWCAIYNCVIIFEKYKSVPELLSAIEQMKFGGS